MSHKKWIIKNADKEKALDISEKFNMDVFLAFLLVSRGLTDTLSVGTFIGDSFVSVSPFNFFEMEEAAFAVGDAIDMGERICIYGDYDCDGVTSTALLYSFLKDEGADVFYYIPSRETEGYGLNKEAIDYIKSEGAELIVTVDNGINSVDEAEYIYSLGMKLVITDHHQIGEELPRAEAVVNPYREENELEFRDYCGVGVAFKLICAMYDGDVNDLCERFIDLVAIGTIADVVPLTDENRAFVKAGLHIINEKPRACVKAFKNKMTSYDKGKKYSANDIAFQLCPRINAMGRMDEADKAVSFLLEEDEEKCAFKFEQLSLENTHRQEVEKSILDDIEKQIEENPKLLNRRVLVFSGEGYHNGVVGIVASHVVEKYAKPAFVVCIDENGIARGSARSIDGFNLYEAISECSDVLIRFGGHPLAAGVTLEADKLDEFTKKINAFALERYEVMPAPSLTVDCMISPEYLTLELVDELKVLEPCGAKNPQPVFGVFKMIITGITPLSEGKHIKLSLEKKGRAIKVVMFNQSFEDFPYHKGDKINAAVKISKNLFKEKNYLSIQALDIHLSSLDEDRYFSEKSDYEYYKMTGKGDKSLYPSRDICAEVYRYLKKNGGFKYAVDELYFRLQDKVNFAQLVFALTAFKQAELIEIGDEISLLPVKSKVMLEDTKILKSVRERLSIE